MVEFYKPTVEEPTVLDSYHEQDPDTGEFYLVEVLSDGSVNVRNAEEYKFDY